MGFSILLLGPGYVLFFFFVFPFILLSGFSACLSVLTKRGVLQSTSAAFYWMGWAQGKAQLVRKIMGEWEERMEYG